MRTSQRSRLLSVISASAMAKRFSSSDQGNGNQGNDNQAMSSLSSRLNIQQQRSTDASSLLPPHLRKGRDISQQSKQVTFQPKVTQLMEVDDDEPDGIFSSSLRVAGDNNVAGVVDEYELIDDAHTYFPLMNARGEPLDKNNAAAAAEQLYIPGQQVIEPGFTRYRVDVQYMGSDFDGWYKSTEKRSRLLRNDGVTAKAAKTSGEDDNDELLYAAERKHRAKTVLEDALAIALDVERVKVEAGVIPEVGCSVRRLTCHVDVPDSNPLQPRTIMQRATAWLEKKQSPIAILSCHPCRNQQFHARHSGTKRVYVYRILNRIAPPLFDAGLQWHVDRFLDVERMQRFADRLQGTMDYGYFADAKMAHALRKEAARSGNPVEGQKLYKVGKGGDVLDDSTKASSSLDFSEPLSGTVRTIENLRVQRQDDEILIWFAGKSFLRHQIRNMVSVLRLAGQGLWSEQELDQALARGFTSSRTKAERERPESAPVHGLTLWSVEYPHEHTDSFVPFVDSGPLPHDGEDVRVVRTF